MKVQPISQVVVLFRAFLRGLDFFFGQLFLPLSLPRASLFPLCICSRNSRDAEYRVLGSYL